MANIPLQSITFPGLSDKYTTPTVDATLTQTGAAADAKKTGDEIGAIKNDLSEFPNGNYPEMGAGYANQLVSGLKKEDQTPYNFRRIPYDATLEEVEKIVGCDVVLNQYLDKDSYPASFTQNGITFTNNGDGSVTANGTATTTATYVLKSTTNPNNDIVIGHVYAMASELSAVGSGSTFEIMTVSENGTANINVYHGSKIVKAVLTYYIWQLVIRSGATVTNLKCLPQFFDLTAMFGTAIADYVYNLETATAGAGVAWLKTHFPKQFDAGYQAYDAGTLKSIEGLSAKKTVGFNQWDEQWEVGYISVSDGQPVDDGGHIRSKNFNRCVSNTAYYYKGNNNRYVFWYDADKNFIEYNYRNSSDTATIMSPANASYFKVRVEDDTNTYNHDICINLSDPTKNGAYEPYEAHSYALDSDVVLRGIPKLDSNNQLYYDGDEYLPDGTVQRRYGIVDLGTLTWSRDATHGYFLNRYNVSPNEYIKTPALNTDYANLLCSKYTRNTATNIINNSGSGIGCTNDGYLIIGDTNYTDPTTFKESLSGVYLLYELATPTTETADPYTTPQIITPDGTEEYIYEDGAFELPVGHSSDYPVDVSGQLDDILDTPSANGTYVLKATVTDGAVAYSWVADA